MIARKSLLIVSSYFFARFLGWVGLVVLAKLWGEYAPEVLGYIGFAIAFLTLFNLITNFGFFEAHVKRISEGKDLGSCIGTFASIKILLTCIMVPAVIVGINIWKNLSPESFADAATESIIYIFLIYYIILNLVDIPLQTFTGTREIAKRQITRISENMVKIPLTILVAIAGVTIVGTVQIAPKITWPNVLQPFQQFLANHAVGSLAMTYVFGVTVSLFIGIYLLRKYPIKKPNWELFKSYFSFAIPIAIIALILIILVNMDKLMIGYFWDSKEVGYYYSVQQISEFIIILATSVGAVLFPTLSEYHSYKNLERMKEKTYLAERYISMVTIPIIVTIIVFAEPIIIFMLSSSFLPAAAPVLIALALYALISSLMMPYSSLISGMNRPNISAKIGISICVTNLCLNYLLIPENGIFSSYGIQGAYGAAIATVVSMIIGLFGFLLAAKKLAGIKVLNNNIPRHIVGGLAMAGLLYGLKILIPIAQWYHLFGFVGAGFIVYVGVLIITKELKKQDMHFFLDILRPKEMVSYIKSELKGKQ